MGKYLIHIGYPKAASTFLQEWFRLHPQLHFSNGGLAGFQNAYAISSKAAEVDEKSFQYYVTSYESLSYPINSYSSFIADYGASKKMDIKQITFIEVVALGFLLFFVNNIIPLIAVICYIGMVIVYLQIGKEIVFIVPSSDSWHFLLSDFYRVLFPFSLIIASSFVNPFCLFLLVFHIVLFPIKMKEMVADFLIFISFQKSSSIQ